MHSPLLRLSRAGASAEPTAVLVSNFGDGDRAGVFPHSAETVNSPQNVRQPEWKVSATRVFAMLSLVLGCAFLVLSLIVLYSGSYRRWNYGLPGVFSLLGLLLSANLIYVGGYTLLRGTIPITPRPLLHRSDLLKARTSLRAMSAQARLISVVILFAACAALGAYAVVSLQQWVASAHTDHDLGFSFYPVLFGRPEDSLGAQAMFWALHFPVSMSVAIFAAMALGIVRERPGAKIAASMGLLFLAAPVTALCCVVLMVPAFILAFLIILYAAYLPMIPVGVVFLNLSRAALINNWDTGVQPTPPKHWSSRFLRTLFTIGCPAGLVLGIGLVALTNDANWLPGGIEMVCAALYGASLVYADRPAVINS